MRMNVVHYMTAPVPDYDEDWALQLRLHEAVVSGELTGALLFQQNSPVITLGRDFKESSLLIPKERLEREGVAVRFVSRGGDATYHGPGVLVASPILRFLDYAKNIHEYLRMLEETVIRQCDAYGLTCFRKNGKSGVWLKEGKLAAVGVAVMRSVTMHGLAINVCPNMEHFSAIVPCGLAGEGVTSLKQQGVHLSVEQVTADFLSSFSRVFGAELLPLKDTFSEIQKEN
jgi:lipoyl(octanoyl) transferase